MLLKCAPIVFVAILKLCAGQNHLWHSYQYSADHQSREELLVTNVTSAEYFRLDHNVTAWKSLKVENEYNLIGLSETNTVIAVCMKLNGNKTDFQYEFSVAELNAKPIDLVLFANWNSTSRKTEKIVVIATNKPELSWFKLQGTNLTHFWSWPTEKTISHINVFKIDNNYQLLIINSYLNRTAGDLYEFELRQDLNIWFRQSLRLADAAKASAFTNVGPHNYLSVPQNSLKCLQIFKLDGSNRFVAYANLTSAQIDQVVTFDIGSKAFVAFNGLQPAIYRFDKDDLSNERVLGTNLNGINYWLPILFNNHNKDELILLAERSVIHGSNHRSLVIEVITYNGNSFEEHEDVPCYYFGEFSDVLHCLIDEEDVKGGIAGSVPISLGGALGLLVPRKHRSSDLFMISSVVNQLPNPVQIELEQLAQMRHNLERLLTDQEKQHDELYKQFGKPDKKMRSDELVELILDSESDLGIFELDVEKIEMAVELIEGEINHLSTKAAQLEKLKSRSEFHTLTIEGPVKLQGNAIIKHVKVDQFGDQSADDFIEDIVRKDFIDHIPGHKTFSNLTVKSLNFETINGIDSDDLLYLSENLIINGNLTLGQPLVVKNLEVSKVNDLDFDSEVIQLDQPFPGKLKFQSIQILGDLHVRNYSLANFNSTPDFDAVKFDTITIPHNILADSVNGENFEQFLNQLCLKNVSTFVSGHLRVIGDISVGNDAIIEHLNNKKYPEDFIFTRNNDHTEITGSKKFENTLLANEVNAELISGIRPSDIITLSTDQEIPGSTFFEDLEVSEILNVTGRIFGEHINKFLLNPTFKDASKLNSNVNFNKLEVDGAVLISGNLDGEDFVELLGNFIYKDEDEVTIKGIKEFPEGFTVRSNLLIDSNTINNISLDDIVTKDTEQEMKLNLIHGIADFENVAVTGLYDSVNVTELDQQTVKLTGEQYISSDVIFREALNVEHLEIAQKFNMEPFENDELDLNGAQIENLHITGNFDGEIANFNLLEFANDRLSYTQDQQIDVDYDLNRLIVDNLDVKQINDRSFKDFFDYEVITDGILQKISEGQMKITDLFVNGSVDVEEVNGERAVNLGGSLFKQGFKKFNVSALKFKNDVFFDDIAISNLSRVPFSSFVDNLVFKNETDLVISGQKTFLKGFTVEKLIETEKINGVPIDDILTKEGPQEVFASLTINGDVVLESNTNITLYEGVPLDFIKENFEMSDGKFKIKGDVVFSRLARIKNLQIGGFVNGKLAQERLDSIVYQNGDYQLDSNITFNNQVTFKGNLGVKNTVNGVDLRSFGTNVVLTTKDNIIESPITFKQPVIIEKRLNVDSNLITKYLNGIDLNLWLESAIFVNKGFLKGNYTFENVFIEESIKTNYVNGVNFSNFIPLRGEQHIDELSFREITCYSDIEIRNLVNGLNLSEEFSNTVMTDSEQKIESPIIFGGKVFVSDHIEIKSLNGLDSSRIVTTNTNQNLSATFKFKSKVVVDGDIISDDLVNNINLTVWDSGAVRTFANYPQNITDNWILGREIIFEDDVTGNGRINRVDFRKFKELVENQTTNQNSVKKNLADTYVNMCKDATFMYKNAKKQIYRFDYLENYGQLDFVDSIRNVHSFQHGGKSYVLISEQSSCSSHLFTFDYSKISLVKDIEIGEVSQVITVYDKNFTFLAIRNRLNTKCFAENTNVWHFVNGTLEHVVNLDDQNLLQDSLVPGTFYGLATPVVTEFRIVGGDGFVVKKYRKWIIPEGDAAFIPRGFSTGLALRMDNKIIKLIRDVPIVEDDVGNAESIIIGTIIEEINSNFPCCGVDDLTVLNVGVRSSRRNLLAIASREETSVAGPFDFIKIFENPLSGKLFHKVASYRPSSLIGLDFGNGETLLVFIEDEKTLQVYEYRGIEGFKRRLTANLDASRLFALSFPVGRHRNERHILGLIDRNRVKLIEAVMVGNKVRDDLKC